MNLQEQIEELEARESDILSQDTIDQEQLRIVRNRLNELRHELEQQQQDAEVVAQVEQAHQERVMESSREIASILDTLDIAGLTMRQMCAGEDEYQLLRIQVQSLFESQADKFSKQIAGYEEREAQIKRQNDNLQGKLAESQTEVTRLNALNNALEQQKADAEQKRDAAVQQLEEAKSEVERLNSQVDDLRKEIAVGARNAYKVQDVDHVSQIKEIAERIKASRIKVVNMRPAPDDFKRQTWLADDAATGETYTFNYLDKGKYLELTDPDEVEQFRQQYEAEKAQRAHDDIALAEPIQTPDIPPVAQVGEQFQGVGMGPDEISAPSAVSEGAGTTDQVSRAEFEAHREEVLKRLYDLEHAVHRADYVA